MSRQCLNCDSYNDSDALHCDQCGASLGAGGAIHGKLRNRSLPWLILTTLLVTLIGLQWSSRSVDPSSEDPDVDPATMKRNPLAGDEIPVTSDLVDIGNLPPGSGNGGTGDSPPLLWGWIDIEDPLGLSLARVPAVMSAQGWLVVPRVSLLGAHQAWFRRGLEGEGQLVEGAFRTGDDLSLWRIEPLPPIDSAPLVPWQSDQAVWRIFPTGGRQQWDPEGPMIRIGSFLRGKVEGGSPAILVQEGSIVGWIPGEQLAGAWLWAGPDEDRLQGASLKEFQRAEFEGGQIAEARKVLDRNLSDLAALQGVARARGRPQILSESEIPPPYQRTRLALATLDRLKSGLSSADPGAYFDQLELADFLWLEAPQLCSLWLSLALRAGDEARLSRAVQVGDIILGYHQQSDDWQQSIDLLPDLWSAGAESHRSTDNIGLAVQWIVEGRRRFPADDTLRLLDAERLLDDGQLDSSADLLEQPVVRSDLKVLRQGLIERLELERRVAGRILIRFTPGATVIRATALVGGVPIDFVVDTGASATSIPPGALAPLGIEIDSDTPRRRVRTASDEFDAPAVALPRVDLGGAVVDGMMATVLDLPGQFNTGLLGMDFLGRFRIDLDVERGWLLLEPR